ncbi:serine protease inhibitor ecotin [Rivibacter subsaxonicus]|uniref:Ecotin n=1 Tax=Rivibacter subsaxonicus TaxID=457575 RepID=A0A4Q7VF25_9BURK|nr:serine protease inhibitor ecotin [Rivibacter subsaxonicus]RZT93838.1 ecotin [Rivibacter subsaxonicus]
MKKVICGLGMLLGLAVQGVAGAATDDLKPFPAAKAGQQRFVIRLPEVDKPDEHRLELIVGKTLQVDCNRHMMGGTVTTKTAQGWGFDYFVVGPVGGGASTMMACPPDMPKREEFVRANLRTPHGRAEAGLLRYNPKIPVVVFVPDGVELRYRVWRADSAMATAGRE